MEEKRVKECLGIAMVGDGVVGVLTPERHCRLWQVGPPVMRSTIAWFAERPGLTRVLCAAEAGLGMWLALRQEPGLSG